MDQERRSLLRRARKEGWSDAKRERYGLGPARKSSGTSKVAKDNEEKPAPKIKKQGKRHHNVTSQTPTQPMGEAEVIEMFGDKTPAVNRGDIVPPPGTRSDRTGRKNIKIISLGQRWSKIMQDVKNEEYTWEEFANTLTPEELARGQLRDSKGTFTGRPPKFVPRAFHDACIRELLNRGQVLYKENYVAAIQSMTDIATNPNVAEKDRIKAAQFVIERLEGKVPDRLEISAADPWQAVIADIVAEVEDDQIVRAQQYLSGNPGGIDA